MFRVIIHQQAKEDISRNANWWADNHSIDQALSWIDTVEKQLQELSQNPYRFGFADENGLFQCEIRQVLVGLGSRRSYRGYKLGTNEGRHCILPDGLGICYNRAIEGWLFLPKLRGML